MTHERQIAMTDTIDLSAYFARVGYAGGGAPTLDTLAALHLRHTEAIAFENLNPVLGWPVDLDPKALVRKLVGERRGGYCYEQNLLFGQVLTALGFWVTGLAGRVRWNTPDCVMTPRSHMLLRVDLDAHPHIVDVGFGVQTPTMPLRLETNVAQTTPHGRFRLIKAGDGFMLEAEVDRA